jgi:dienelactone hydrolase
MTAAGSTTARVAGVPALLRYRESPEAAAGQGTVLFYHGFGVAGRSLGGNIAFASVLADSRVRAAVSAVGSPEWTLPRPHSPHHHEYQGVGHFLTPGLDTESGRAMVAWFRRWLP